MQISFSFLVVLLLHHLGWVRCYDEEVVAIMYTVEVITTSDCALPKSTGFDVSCGDGGRIRDLSADEGLGLADCIAKTNDGSSLTCEDGNVDSHSAVSTASNLVFACEGPTAASREASVSLREHAIDCSETPFGMASYGRSLQVAAVCSSAPGMVAFPLEFDDNQCVGGGVASLVYLCKARSGCGNTVLAQYSDSFDDDGPCGASMPLESFGLQVANSASLLDSCLWKPEDLSSSANDVGNAPIQLNGGPLAASYEVFLNTDAGVSIYGDECAFGNPSKIHIQCGPGSELVSNDLDGTPMCERLGPEAFDCEVDANAMVEGFLSISVAINCVGSTREALSLEVIWDPKNIECTQGPSWGGELATLSYAMRIWQTCAILQQDYTSTSAQQCSPITATRYNSLAMHIPELDPDLNLGGELCSILRLNCHAGGQCDGAGKQEMGSLKVRVPPSMVDLSCAEGGDVELPNNGNAGMAGGNAGPADALANNDPEMDTREEDGGDDGRVDGGANAPAGNDANAPSKDAQGVTGVGESGGSKNVVHPLLVVWIALTWDLPNF